jgi:hypothetical protein
LAAFQLLLLPDALTDAADEKVTSIDFVLIPFSPALMDVTFSFP